MADHDDLDHSRQGQLKKNSIPLRPSVDRASRSSSELEDELDELQFDQDHAPKFRNGRRWPWVAKFRRIISGEGPSYPGQRKAVPRPSRSSRIRACCWRRRVCLIVTGILLAGFIILLSGSALWVYKTAPEDGVRVIVVTIERADFRSSNHHPGIHRRKEGRFQAGKRVIAKPRRWWSK